MALPADKRSQQAFWVIGALERLQGLGFISDVRLYVAPGEIDAWQSVDERRREIMDDDSVWSLTRLICADSGMEDKESIAKVALAVFHFRDHREDMVKFAMKRTLS